MGNGNEVDQAALAAFEIVIPNTKPVCQVDTQCPGLSPLATSCCELEKLAAAVYRAVYED